MHFFLENYWIQITLTSLDSNKFWTSIYSLEKVGYWGIECVKNSKRAFFKWLELMFFTKSWKHFLSATNCMYGLVVLKWSTFTCALDDCCITLIKAAGDRFMHAHYVIIPSVMIFMYIAYWFFQGK